MNNTKTLLAAAAMAVALGGSPALAGIEVPLGDVSGTWTGTLKCTLYDASGNRTKTTEDVTMLMSHGEDVRINTSYSGGARGVNPAATVCATAVPKGDSGESQLFLAVSPHKPSSGDQTSDATDSDLLAMGLSVKLSGADGKAKGRALPLAHDGSAGECKLKLVRVDDTDPSVNLFDCFTL